MKTQSILIIDENSIALRELVDILKYLSYKEIQQVADANDAWSIMQVKSFDCIIAAWDMPNMSGLALLRVARNDDKFFHTPFFLTDPAFTKIKVIQAGQAGVSGLIVTPYDVENLKNKMLALSDIPETENTCEEELTLNEGLELIENNNYKKALKVFNKLVDQGENAEYYFNIGYIKTAQEKYGEAIEAFRKATQLDRLFAKAFEAMGRAYNQLGQPGEAEKYLQKAADIYMSKENTDDAEQILNEIIEINPDTINVYNSLGVLYRKKGDLKTALKNYLKAIKVHPEEPYIHYNIGRIYLEMKNPAEAKKHFSEALTVDPEFEEAKEVLNAIELGTI